MGHLESGHYVPANAKRVTVWPAPDADGDGEEVWRQEYAASGEPIGRSRVKDQNGRDVFRYEVPEGFLAVPTSAPGSDDAGVSYVRRDERGRIWRHPRTGEAAGIREGSVLIEHPNGDFECLTDEYSQYLFAKAHEKTDTPDDDSLVIPPNEGERVKEQQELEDRKEFEAWKADRKREAETEEVPA